MDETTLNPQSVAQAVAYEVAEDRGEVGDFAAVIDLGDGVSDYRFACLKRGYEGWQWTVTLYHDAELDTWTVDESALVPTDRALTPPAWVAWKDRLRPEDLAVVDSIGTDPDDPRIEAGVAQTDADGVPSATEVPAGDDAISKTGSEEAHIDEDARQAVESFMLTRRHVLSPLGRSQAAQRWYQGPRGPKSLSTKTAAGEVCSTCGFFVPLQGDLHRMFGVCANKWSPDDARVVSIDHGCGEHSEIKPPEPTPLWVQSQPAYDDLHIDVVEQAPREERDQVEIIEELTHTEDDDSRVSDAPIAHDPVDEADTTETVVGGSRERAKADDSATAESGREDVAFSATPDGAPTDIDGTDAPDSGVGDGNRER